MFFSNIIARRIYLVRRHPLEFQCTTTSKFLAVIFQPTRTGVRSLCAHPQFNDAPLPADDSDSTKKSLPPDIREKLTIVNHKLALSLADPIKDANRGVDAQAARLRNEAPSNRRRRRINSKVAKAELARLLYQRHALKNGFHELTDMVKFKGLEKSFLGAVPPPKQIITLVQAKCIIKEEFRYGKSKVLEDFKKKRAEDQLRANFTQQKQHEAEVRKFKNEFGESPSTTDEDLSDDERRKSIAAELMVKGQPHT